MRVTNIDTSTIEGKIEVMQRAAKGEKVAYMLKPSNDWDSHDRTNAWDWCNYNYQIILPEPREFFLVRESSSQQYIALPFRPSSCYKDVIHAREVLPNESESK